MRTVGELEVIEHVRAGGACVDCRQPEYYAQGSLPGAVNVPHQHILDGAGSPIPQRPTVLFCNGPQCTATPQAVARLLRGRASARPRFCTTAAGSTTG